MIEAVMAKNFKGASFEMPLAKRMLVVGKNGSGKSMRSQALMLALTGHVPGAGKTNAAIHDAFATSTTMSAGVKLDGAWFERQFIRANSGTVTCRYRINSANAGQKGFIEDMARCGKPAVFNIQLFLELSNQKKIEQIFAVFPPKGDLNGIDQKIIARRGEINAVQQDIRTNQKAIERLSGSAAEMNLPNKSMPELKAEIDKANEDLKAAERQLEDLKREEEAERKKLEEERKAEASRRAEEERKAEAARRAENERLAKIEAEKAREAFEKERDKVAEMARLARDGQREAETAKVEAEAAKQQAAAAQKERNDAVSQYEAAIAEAQKTEKSRQLAIFLIHQIVMRMDKPKCQMCTAKFYAQKSMRDLNG